LESAALSAKPQPYRQLAAAIVVAG
jgi:hypothetical protein